MGPDHDRTYYAEPPRNAVQRPAMLQVLLAGEPFDGLLVPLPPGPSTRPLRPTSQGNATTVADTPTSPGTKIARHEDYTKM